jgi:hypothetical protein
VKPCPGRSTTGAQQEESDSAEPAGQSASKARHPDEIYDEMQDVRVKEGVRDGRPEIRCQPSWNFRIGEVVTRREEPEGEEHPNVDIRSEELPNDVSTDKR